MSESMAKIEDMQWLVEHRSKNQALTMLIYECYREYNAYLLIDGKLRVAAQRLTMASFSLWRAVFLSDTEPRKDLQVVDATNFLENLILHNMIGYQNDQKARNFTFRYYVLNAQDRLNEIVRDKRIVLLPEGRSGTGAGLTAQKFWELNHNDLEQAVHKFRALLQSLQVPAPAPAGS